MVDTYVGLQLDARDDSGVWAPGVVVKAMPRAVRIAYTGWPREWDEWIDKSSDRLAKMSTNTQTCRCWVRTDKAASSKSAGHNRWSFWWPGFLSVRAPSDQESSCYLYDEDSHYVELVDFYRSGTKVPFLWVSRANILPWSDGTIPERTLAVTQTLKLYEALQNAIRRSTKDSRNFSKLPVFIGGSLTRRHFRKFKPPISKLRFFLDQETGESGEEDFSDDGNGDVASEGSTEAAEFVAVAVGASGPNASTRNKPIDVTGSDGDLDDTAVDISSPRLGTPSSSRKFALAGVGTDRVKLPERSDTDTNDYQVSSEGRSAATAARPSLVPIEPESGMVMDYGFRELCEQHEAMEAQGTFSLRGWTARHICSASGLGAAEKASGKAVKRPRTVSHSRRKCRSPTHLFLTDTCAMN